MASAPSGGATHRAKSGSWTTHRRRMSRAPSNPSDRLLDRTQSSRSRARMPFVSQPEDRLQVETHDSLRTSSKKGRSVNLPKWAPRNKGRDRGNRDAEAAPWGPSVCGSTHTGRRKLTREANMSPLPRANTIKPLHALPDLAVLGRGQLLPSRIEHANPVKPARSARTPTGNEARTERALDHESCVECVSSDGSSLGRRVVA